MGKRPSGRPGRDPDAMFAEADTNGDGYLSADEIDAMVAKRLARRAANGDGAGNSVGRSGDGGGGQ